MYEWYDNGCKINNNNKLITLIENDSVNNVC